MAKKILAQKINASSTQVIKTLNVLLQGDYTMRELIDMLNQNEPEPIFNNSVISKYINTCRYCEFDIQKIHNKDYVAKIPFGLDLSVLDVDLINRAIDRHCIDNIENVKFNLVVNHMDCIGLELEYIYNNQVCIEPPDKIFDVITNKIKLNFEHIYFGYSESSKFAIV